MAQRTYEVGLLLVSKRAQRYMSRWYTQLGVHLTPQEKTCLDAALEALQALIICISPPPDGD